MLIWTLFITYCCIFIKAQQNTTKLVFEDNCFVNSDLKNYDVRKISPNESKTWCVSTKGGPTVIGSAASNPSQSEERTGGEVADDRREWCSDIQWRLSSGSEESDQKYCKKYFKITEIYQHTTNLVTLLRPIFPCWTF